FIVGLLGDSGYVQPPVVIEGIDQRLYSRFIGSAHEHRAETVLPIEVRADLVEIAPDFAAGRRITRIHYANHVPLTSPEFQPFADLRVRITLRNRLADHHLAMSLLEPTSFGDAEATHLDSYWR